MRENLQRFIANSRVQGNVLNVYILLLYTPINEIKNNIGRFCI